MEVDSPKSQDWSKVMADTQTQHDSLAHQNKEELHKYLFQQIEESTLAMNTSSEEVEEARNTATKLKRTVYSQEIDLDSLRNLKTSLEDSLREVETRCAIQMEQISIALLHLEVYLGHTGTKGQCQAQEWKALLNIKVKLEAEINTSPNFQENAEDLNLVHALESSSSFLHKTRIRTLYMVKWWQRPMTPKF